MEKKCNEIRTNFSFRQEIELSKKLQVTITIPKSVGRIKKIEMHVNRYGEEPYIKEKLELIEENSEYGKYVANIKFDACKTYYYFFFLEMISKSGEIVNKAIKVDRETEKPFITDLEKESPYWIVKVINNNYEVPKWARATIYYQIFVDRFYKSKNVVTGKQKGRNYRNWGEFPDWCRNDKGDYHNNDFFCGNLRGIEEKLEYLKSLSVKVIYLSPINESLYRYERYASTNHMEIDPDAGTFEDLANLHEKALNLGMHIILDIALNHCSFDNPIFQDALKNRSSKYRDWFYFDDNNNYAYWYNEFRDMPIFNQYNPEVQNYVYGENGIIAKFSKYVDGFRLDVAEELKPFFKEGIRNRANKNGNRIIIGEYWNPADPTILGKGIDSVTNYNFTNDVFKYVLEGNFELFKYQVEYILNLYPTNASDTMLNSLDTHDIVRALTILGGRYMRYGEERIWEIDKDPSPWHYFIENVGKIFDTQGFRKFEYENDKLEKVAYEYAKKLLKLSTIILYLLPGCPCVFYGTEVGLHGYKDPFNRKCFPWDNIDEELLEFYRTFLKFRSKMELANSIFKVIEGDQNYLMFKVYNSKNSILVVANRTNQIMKVNIPEEFEISKDEFYLNATREKIEPYGAIVIKK